MRLKQDIEDIYRLIVGGRAKPTTTQVKAVVGKRGPSYELLRKWRDPKSAAFPDQFQLLRLLAAVDKVCPDASAARKQWRDGVKASWWLATEAEDAARGGPALDDYSLVVEADNA